jgi:glycerol-3-phosphate dehydrogenase
MGENVMADVMEAVRPEASQASNHVDVLIVGAGISGVGSPITCRTNARAKAM